MKKICIVTSGHPPHDERIFWKFALSLVENGNETSIICSTAEISAEEKGVIFKGFNGENLSKRAKITKLEEIITHFHPDIIICCEPLTILAAAGYRSKNKNCKIVSDVTEWYPENVAFKKRGLKRWITYAALTFFNIYTIAKTDALIIGEPGKKKRYDRIARFKKKEIICYYPVLRYFSSSLKKIDNELVLGYAGLISRDRGILTLFKAASRIASENPSMKVRVKLLGKFSDKDEEETIMKNSAEIKNVSVQYAGFTTYDKISDHIADMHLCFDLRIRNFIYNNSLPIKIFEYMAAGKPFIYSDIKPIRREFKYEYCGHLVDPNNLNDICEAINKYIKDRELLFVHSRNGRRMVEEEMNWEKESRRLIRFLDQI